VLTLIKLKELTLSAMHRFCADSCAMLFATLSISTGSVIGSAVQYHIEEILGDSQGLIIRPQVE